MVGAFGEWNVRGLNCKELLWQEFEDLKTWKKRG